MHRFLRHKTAWAQMLIILFVLTFAAGIRPARASNTIYIMPDGSINPVSAPIAHNGSLYYLTDNINEPIIIQKGDITVDGFGYTLQGSREVAGFIVGGVYGVTIRNTNIRGFDAGIILNMTSVTIADNNITDNNLGILMDNSNVCLILRNYVSANGYGVYMRYSFNNTFYHNCFVNNTSQVYVLPVNASDFWDSGYPLGGNYWSNYTGVDLYRGPYQNESGSDGIGDTGYSVLGGEIGTQEDYYPLMDPFRSLTGTGENVSTYPTDHIWLTFTQITISGLVTVETLPTPLPEPPTGFLLEQCYIIDTSAVYSGTITIRIIYDDSAMIGDRRLMRVVPVLGDVNDDFAVDILDIVCVAHAFGSETGDLTYRPKLDLNGDGAVDIFDLVVAAGHFGQVWNPTTGWKDITSYVDTANHLVIGQTDHLSIFGVTFT